MAIFWLILALAAGFVVLVISGDLLVRGSTKLARRLGVPPLIVGLTIVAFGTSAPELVVSIQAVLAGAPELALGNIVGSNIANVLLVLGIPAVICVIHSDASGLTRNSLFALAASVGLLIFAYTGPLGALQGSILLAGLVAYLGILWWRAHSHATAPPEDVKEYLEIDDIEGLPESWVKVWVFIAVGLIGLPLGGHLIVRSGVDIAEVLNIPREFVGLTLVAFGTSLPELATSIVAAFRRQADVAIGNVIGSNVFNVLAVGGVASLIGDIPIPPTFLQYDLWVMVAAGVALVAIAVTKRPIGRALGLAFIVVYAAYVFGLAQIEGVI